MLWAANLIQGPTFVYGIDAESARVTSKRRGDSEIVAMAAGAGAVWAVSHDRATLLRIDPRSGRVARRIALASEPHGVAFGSGYVWVALYHQSTIVRVDPHTNRILGPPIGAGFPTEPLASAGGRLWAIPSTGGSLADPQLHIALEIDARSGRIVNSYRTRGRPQDLVAAGDSVWVATTEPNELVRSPAQARPELMAERSAHHLDEDTLQPRPSPHRIVDRWSLRPPPDRLAALRRTQEHPGPFRGTDQALVR